MEEIEETESDSSFMMVLLFLVGIVGFYYLWTKKNQPQRIVQTPNPIKSSPSITVKKPVNGSQKSSKTEIPPDFVPVKIFFGSQTGTAEDFSHKLSAEAKQYKFYAQVVDLEDYDGVRFFIFFLKR